MDHSELNRRSFLKTAGLGSAAVALSAQPSIGSESDAEVSGSMISIDPRRKFELSPYLYMQFMEPLGATDGSVAAAWDDLHETWRESVIEATRALAPTMIRWGGCYSSYYRWLEGVGPRDQRTPMLNLLWGGALTV